MITKVVEKNEKWLQSSLPKDGSLRSISTDLNSRLGTPPPQDMWLSSLVRPPGPLTGQLEQEDHKEWLTWH